MLYIQDKSDRVIRCGSSEDALRHRAIVRSDATTQRVMYTVVIQRAVPCKHDAEYAWFAVDAQDTTLRQR